MSWTSSSNRYLKSYSSLSLLNDYFENSNLKTQIKKYADDEKKEKIETIFKSIIGLYALGKYNLESINSFITNNYFQDALKIDLLPSANILFESLQEHKDILIKIADSMNAVGAEKNLQDVYQKDFIENKPSDNLKEVLGRLHLQAVSGLKFIAKSGMTGELANANSLFTNEIKEKLDHDGYAIIEGVLSKEEVTDLRALVLKVAEAERKSGHSYLYGGDDSCQRIYNLLNKHQVFRDLIQRPVILEIMEHMFARDTLHDKYVLSSWHCNIIGGGGEASILHLDSAVPEPLPPWMIRTNINYMLDDFTVENGATLCLPGSHRYLKKPTNADQNRPDLVAMTAPRGSLGIWNGHLWHKSGTNKTMKERIALLGCFAASHLREMAMEENHLQVIKKDIVRNMTPTLQRLIGANHGIKKGAFEDHPDLQDN